MERSRLAAVVSPLAGCNRLAFTCAVNRNQQVSTLQASAANDKPIARAMAGKGCDATVVGPAASTLGGGRVEKKSLAAAGASPYKFEALSFGWPLSRVTMVTCLLLRLRSDVTTGERRG